MEEIDEDEEINEIDEINNFHSMIKASKILINKNIYIFLFFLLKNIFLKKKKNIEFDNYLNTWTNKINQKIIKNEDKFINEDYSINNFNNIIDFIKSQNKTYAGDIIEGILIIIFSYGFKIDKEKSFSKYIYYNFELIKNTNNYDLCKWYKSKKFKPKELEDIKLLFQIDSFINYEIFAERRNNFILYYLLTKIFITKYLQSLNNPNRKNKFNKSLMNNSSNEIYKKRNSLNKSFILSKNSIRNILYNSFFLDNFEKTKQGIKIIRPFFISVYIYYQIKHSPLVKYIKPEYISVKNKLINIPFEFNLKYAKIEEKFAPVIFSALRLEPRITKIILSSNNLGKFGLFELSKTLLFNKNIKIIEYEFSLNHSYDFPFINYGLGGLLENNSVEEINLSFNYLNPNCEENLAKFISYFKGLKTLNLSDNKLKSGISSLFIALRKLYSKGKTKLENLYLKRCFLDEISYYELGQLIKSKYCKLKILSISSNEIPINLNFWQKLIKNKSLINIYLNKNNIFNGDINYIVKAISNSYIRHLYLYKNKIYNFNNCLKLLYRTKLIKDKKEENSYLNKDESILINLDMSNNEFFFINSKHIKLLIKITKETTLSCLDISHILFGHNPDQMPKTKQKKNYINTVEELKEMLIKDKNKYYKIIKEIINNKADIKEFIDLESEEIFKNINEKIAPFIQDENSIFPVFLREKAIKLIYDENNFAIKKIIDKNKIFEKMKAKEIIQKLINYMIVQKAKDNLIRLEKEKKIKN